MWFNRLEVFTGFLASLEMTLNQSFPNRFFGKYGFSQASLTFKEMWQILSKRIML